MVFAEPLFTRIQFLTIDTGCPRLFFGKDKLQALNLNCRLIENFKKLTKTVNKYIKVRF